LCPQGDRTYPPPHRCPPSCPTGTALRSPGVGEPRWVRWLLSLTPRMPLTRALLGPTLTRRALATMPSTIASVKGSKDLSGRLMNSGLSRYPLRPLYSNTPALSCMGTSGGDMAGQRSGRGQVRSGVRQTVPCRDEAKNHQGSGGVQGPESEVESNSSGPRSRRVDR
jgi:hypothetical protein